MEQINEQWRPIEGYEGLYEVSNMGRVRSSDSYNRFGRLHLKGRILKPQINHKGYLKVGLHKEGKQKLFSVHRLVAQAFIPNPEGLPQINHIDEDKTNNVVDNLEWCTQKYNINYGTHTERQVQTKIRKGMYDPEMCGIWNKDRQEYDHLRYQKNIERLREYKREYMREYRRRKEKKSNLY